MVEGRFVTDELRLLIYMASSRALSPLTFSHIWDMLLVIQKLKPSLIKLPGLISHNSIHLLIITTDFVALYRFTGYVVFIITSFLVVLSLETSVCTIVTFYPVFLRS